MNETDSSVPIEKLTPAEITLLLAPKLAEAYVVYDSVLLITNVSGPSI